MKKDIKNYIRDIPNFPKEGIIFKDITPVLKDPIVFSFAVNEISSYFTNKGVNKVVSMEARGFIFGSVISYILKCGFIPVRKKGKLPYKTISIEYELEYGKDILEIHEDAIENGDNVLIVDDVLATGGTAKAVASLVEKCGGKVVGMGFLVELTFLNPRKKLEGYDIYSLVKY
ncbi:MAG: adenine phosphoribosyltransferase [Elusimicrobiota bacterium]|nr:adenine phosphoribosyltransferase [Endomicrobiia bacterium]MDW8165801.1 adenine phosphoribosyltransferase [Elusimicrobiota bacterium]